MKPDGKGAFPGHGLTTEHGFEVNTDVALVNPDWDDIAGSHDHRYGLAISHLKSIVKGRTYDNAAMRVRVGKAGYYVQSRRFPAAFFGDTSRARVRTVSADEARAVTWEAVAFYRSGEAESLTCIYGPGAQGEFFFGYRVANLHRFEFGSLRPGTGMHMRVMINAEEPCDLLGGERRGVVIHQELPGDRHVLITASGRRQPYPAMVEIAE